MRSSGPATATRLRELYLRREELCRAIAALEKIERLQNGRSGETANCEELKSLGIFLSYPLPAQ